MVQGVKLLVEGRCRLRIHQIQMNVCQLYAMLKHIKTTAVRPRFLLIYKGNKGVFSFFFIDFAQSLQLFRLSCFKESEQSLAVHRKKTVELRCRSLYVPAFRLYKLVNDITLIFFFRKDVIHYLSLLIKRNSLCGLSFFKTPKKKHNVALSLQSISAASSIVLHTGKSAI